MQALFMALIIEPHPTVCESVFCSGEQIVNRTTEPVVSDLTEDPATQLPLNFGVARSYGGRVSAVECEMLLESVAFQPGSNVVASAHAAKT